jgi:hypothetical protein
MLIYQPTHRPNSYSTVEPSPDWRGKLFWHLKGFEQEVESGAKKLVTKGRIPKLIVLQLTMLLKFYI